jgi:transcriptional regulator with XRE-family HTH domain
MATRATNGEAIRAMRKILGIRQDALAARAGIGAPWLSKIENGTAQPELETAKSIANGLGVKLEAITYPVPDTAELAASA